MGEVTNFAKFYALFRRLPVVGQQRDDVKGELVWQFSDGRTHSLREMRKQEYEALCEALQREVDGAADMVKRMAYVLELKRHRSAALKLMQRMGINTTDWNRVNSFCADARICGKAFRSLSIDELKALAVKLRLIERKGGLKADAGGGRPATGFKLRATSDGHTESGGEKRGGERMVVSLLIPLGGEKS